MSTATAYMPDDLTRTINRTIRALLVLRGMTPEQFQARAGLARNTYYNRMKGRGDWTAHEMKRAADALGVSVATLYDGLSVAGAGFEPATSGQRVASPLGRTMRPWGGSHLWLVGGSRNGHAA